VPFTVHGYLIGAIASADTSVQGARDLAYEMRTRGPTEQWEVFTLEQLMDRAWRVHVDAISVLEKAESEEDVEAVPTALPAPAAVRLIASSAGPDTEAAADS
jgi:hypothetical protein